MISSPKCGGLLFVVLCDVVWFPVFLRWFILKDRLFNQRFGRQRCRSGSHGYSGDFNFIICFYRHYAVICYYFGCCEFIRRLSFTFLAMLNDVISQFEWISFCFCQKKKLVVQLILRNNPTSLSAMVITYQLQSAV